MKHTRNVTLVTLFLLLIMACGNGQEKAVTDSKTHLMWQQGEGGKMEWDTAIAYCNNLSLARYNDWRLPNRKELESIIAVGKTPAINKINFPDALDAPYWSSTTGTYNASCAWLVHFGYDATSCYDKTNSNYVRCVRGAQ